MRVFPSLIIILLSLLVVRGYAEELGDLPTDHLGFQNRLSVFMVPGGPLTAAVELLERNEFRCFDNTALGQTFYCVYRRGGAMGSSEIIHEVWLEYDLHNKITNIISGVTVLPGSN